MKINVKMDGDKVCIAWFKKKIKKYILTTKAEPPEGGTITGAGTYDEGTVVPVEAIPAEGYDFDHWEDIGKWSGLGMHIYPSWLNYVETMLANGFEELAMGAGDYENAQYLIDAKSAIIEIIAKGATVTWGITTNNTLTTANWEAYAAGVKAGATWSQANGVFEFKIGNELEWCIDETTLTQSQLIANLKSLATEVKAIFTNGNICYSCGQNQDIIDAWVTAGRGNIDIIASNIYKGGTWDGGSDPYDFSYQDRINSLITAFGADHTYLTEFNVSYSNLKDYSTDEAVQATAVTEMIDYIKASGMTRAIFFMWKDDGAAHFGVMKADETYRLLWDSLLNSN